MFISLSTWVYEPMDVAAGVAAIQRNGFRAVEVSGERWLEEKAWQQVVAHCRAGGVRIASIHCCHHAPSEKEAVARSGYEDYHRRIYESWAKSVEPGTIIVEHVPLGPYAQNRNRAVDELSTVVALGKEYGLRIATENMPNGLTAPADMQDLLSQVPGLLWTFDAAHAGYSPVDPRSFIPLFDERLVNIHVYDVHPTVRLGDWLPISMGKVPWTPILAGLQAVGYNGPLTIELTEVNMRAVLAVCDQILRSTMPTAPQLGALPWEDLFACYSREALLRLCAEAGVHVA